MLELIQNIAAIIKWRKGNKNQYCLRGGLVQIFLICYDGPTWRLAGGFIPI